MSLPCLTGFHLRLESQSHILTRPVISGLSPPLVLFFRHSSLFVCIPPTLTFLLHSGLCYSLYHSALTPDFQSRCISFFMSWFICGLFRVAFLGWLCVPEPSHCLCAELMFYNMRLLDYFSYILPSFIMKMFINLIGSSHRENDWGLTFILVVLYLDTYIQCVWMCVCVVWIRKMLGRCTLSSYQY